MSSIFFIHQTTLVALLLSIYYGAGKLVSNKGIKVNYTRKINHFAIFFLPMALNLIFEYQKTTSTRIFGLIVGIFTLALFVMPLRKRSKIISTMFLSFDRPEDRPNTLLWLTTQYIAATIVIIPLVIYLNSINQSQLALIPVLINGLGDGLAEPIGVRFGRTKYQTRALFSDKLYVRSIEGSLCVFVFGILSVIAFKDSFTSAQFVASLVVIPIGTTLAEAYSPHTWDTPFIYGVAGAALICILNFI
jgi:phytol kinase